MANNKAYFYYRSYCDQDVNGYTFTTDFSNNTNVNDRNKLTYAVTSGDDTDGDSVDFVVDLTYDRAVDTIVLKSNLKTFTIYYWNGSSYVELQAYTVNAAGFIVLSVTEVSASKIKITATHTITANEEKKIYNLEITKKITEMYLESVEINKNWENTVFGNIYGGSVKINKYPNHGKVNIDLSFENLNGDSFTAYNTLKNQILTDSYAIYVYFSDTYNLLDIEAYYLVNDLSNYPSNPASEAMTSGVSGEMNLREV